jgi:hypothetical protein
MGGGVSGAEHRAGEVDGQNLLPGFQCQFGQGRMGHDPGVVDQDIEDSELRKGCLD